MNEPRRRPVALSLAILLAALASILSGTTASASAMVGTETRVGAFNVAGEVLAEPLHHVSAGQRLGKDVPQAESVVATGVAANTGARLLSPSSLADEVVNATGGVLKTNKGGFTVEIPHGARGITVRVMERGGSRTNYYRVSVPGKETYTVTDEASTDAALTHIGITESSLDDILSIVARIQGGG